jgi:hypothetical protein
VYSLAISCDISASPQFKECFQLLGFQSQEDLLAKLERVLDFVERVPSNLPVEVLRSASKIDIGECINRQQLKEVSAILFRLVVSCDNM